MKRLAQLCLGWLAVVMLHASVHAAAPQIDALEPPHWWIGFSESRLQLLVYGPGIAKARVSLAGPGWRLERVERTDSANHLFLHLVISASATPGPRELIVTRDGVQRRQPYLLKAREPGSAKRRGFDGRDVILNLMPDRFANGNTSNDNVPGMGDPADRSAPGGRHGGDLQGVIDRLDYLSAMGFTAIWMTPVLENRQTAYSYHGYAATDLYRVDPRLGTLDDYKRLAAEARRRGLGIIQDAVPNHIGDGHRWLRDPPSRDWIHPAPPQAPLTHHARTSIRDGYAVQGDRDRFTRGWFAPSMPDLNTSNRLLAQYLEQATVWWIEEVGLMGLRVDTWSYSDAGFLSRWAARLRREYPRLGIVGEEWSLNPVVVAAWQGGNPLFGKPLGRAAQSPADTTRPTVPSLMDFPLHDTLRRALVEPESWGTGWVRLYEFMVNDRLYADASKLVLFDGNHDVPRLAPALNHDPALQKMALAYLLTTRRIPQLYYGVEVMLDSPKTHDAFDLFRADFPGGWPGDPVDAVSGKGLSAAQADLQQWLRRLMIWRKSQAAIHRGELTHFFPEDGSYVFVRHLPGAAPVLVAFNKADQARALGMRRFRSAVSLPTHGTDVTTGEALDLRSELLLPPKGVRIIEFGKGSR
jgi:glycosidase